MRARLARLLPAGYDFAQGIGALLVAVGVGLIFGIGAAMIVAGAAVLLFGIARERG